MNMTTKKKSTPALERKVTMLVTSDMVLDLYTKAKKTKGVEKKVLMERVVFLSQNLNRYTPLIPSHFLV